MSHLFQVHCFHHGKRVGRPNAGDSTDSDVTRRWSNKAGRHRSKGRAYTSLSSSSSAPSSSSVPSDHAILDDRAISEDLEQPSWIVYSYSDQAEAVAAYMDCITLPTWAEEHSGSKPCLTDSDVEGCPHHVPPYLRVLDGVCTTASSTTASLRDSDTNSCDAECDGTEPNPASERFLCNEDDFDLIGLQRVGQIDFYPVSGDQKRRKFNHPELADGDSTLETKQRSNASIELDGILEHEMAGRRSSLSSQVGERVMVLSDRDGALPTFGNEAPTTSACSTPKETSDQEYPLQKDSQGATRAGNPFRIIDGCLDSPGKPELVSPETYTSESEEDDATLGTVENTTSEAKETSRRTGCSRRNKVIALLVAAVLTFAATFTLAFLLRRKSHDGSPNSNVVISPQPSPETKSPNIFQQKSRRPRALSGLRRSSAFQVEESIPTIAMAGGPF